MRETFFLLAFFPPPSGEIEPGRRGLAALSKLLSAPNHLTRRLLPRAQPSWENLQMPINPSPRRRSGMTLPSSRAGMRLSRNTKYG